MNHKSIEKHLQSSKRIGTFVDVHTLIQCKQIKY